MKLLERVDEINLRKLAEGSREDLLRSFFSLVKTNGGRYKSDKQGAFLMSQSEDGMFAITQQINFGTSKASQRFINWVVYLDGEGVVKITKHTNSKGEELYWDREGTADSISSKNAERDAANLGHKRKDMEEMVKYLEREVAEQEAELQKVKTNIDNPAAASVRDYLISRLPEYEARVEAAKRVLAQHQETLQKL